MSLKGMYKDEYNTVLNLYKDRFKEHGLVVNDFNLKFFLEGKSFKVSLDRSVLSKESRNMLDFDVVIRGENGIYCGDEYYEDDVYSIYDTCKISYNGTVSYEMMEDSIDAIVEYLKEDKSHRFTDFKLFDEEIDKLRKEYRYELNKRVGNILKELRYLGEVKEIVQRNNLLRKKKELESDGYLVSKVKDSLIISGEEVKVDMFSIKITEEGVEYKDNVYYF